MAAGDKNYWCGLLLLFVCGCAASTPASPTPGGSLSSYAGEWKGEAVSFGPGGTGTISFIVSDNNKVTTISVNSTVNGCAISRTLSGLSLGVVSEPSRAPS